MLDHVTVKVKDFDKEAAFYEAALAPLGYTKAVAFPGVQQFAAADGSKPSQPSMPLASPTAAPTTASPALVRTTARITTPLSCTTPKATTSRPCCTSSKSHGIFNIWQ